MAVNIIALLTKLCKRVKIIENTFVTKGMYQYICNAKSITTIDANNNDALVSNIYLIGNVLRGYYSNTSLSLGAGNISNVTSHKYKIRTCFGTYANRCFDKLVGKSFWSGSTGGIVTYNLSDNDQIQDGSSLTYTVEFTATHAAVTKSNSYYWLSASMNPDYDFISNESS